jgi:hypothetical protein
VFGCNSSGVLAMSVHDLAMLSCGENSSEYQMHLLLDFLTFFFLISNQKQAVVLDLIASFHHVSPQVVCSFLGPYPTILCVKMSYTKMRSRRRYYYVLEAVIEGCESYGIIITVK